MSMRVLMGGLLVTLLAAPAFAENPPTRFLGSAVWVDKTGEDQFEGTLGAGELDVDFDAGMGVAFGINYFFRERLSLEVKGGALQSDARIRYVTSEDSEAILKLGHLRVFPLTAVAQYHFAMDGDWTPFVGAGVSYTFLDADRVDFSDDTGLVLNAGLNVDLSTRFDLNLDAKYVAVETSTEGRSAFGSSGDLKLQPLLLSAGIAYKF